MATNTCAHCGATYSRPPSLLGDYCSKTCGYAHRRMARTTARRMRKVPDHPLAPPSGYVSEARIVLYEKIGPGPHSCHWCGADIRWLVGRRGNVRDAITADHVNSDELDDSPENLVPSCGPCNGTRGARVGDEEEFVVRANGGRLRGARKVCAHCGDSFVTAEKQPGKGLFCSRSCARRKSRAAQTSGVAL